MIRNKNIRNDRNKVGGRSAPSAMKRFLTLILIVIVIAAGTFGFVRYKQSRSGTTNTETGLFSVKRGDLIISVTESGGIKAVKSEIIKSDVESRTTIVNIVPEGTIITPEDVNSGKILVELDSSNLTEQLPQREIEFAAAEASHAEAKESYDIQIKQNESDITAAELKVKFALMDLQKYLGETAAQKVIQTVNQDPNSEIDMAELLEDIEDPNSGCEASQKLRDLTGEITLSQENLEKATYTLSWTEKLYEREYVAETELREHRLQKTRFEIEKEKAGIALKLFKLYEFPKQVEQLLSDYNEAGLELERTKARARSQLSQAKAKLASAEATLGLRKERLDKVNKQLEACIIKAPAPGQVVYSSSTERWSRVKIEQGAEVPRGYKIIEIPDTSKMKVEIKVHEVWIDKIQVDQEAKILVSAFPDKTFTGKVLKKAPLADPQNWLNEELKVYATDVGIDGTHDFLKTGMTGKVEVIIDELHDVLYIPIQSVVTEEETKICYVKTNKGTEKRVVETGLFNDDFIEIKSGLTEGEMVLLNPPRWIVSETKEEETKEEEMKEEETKEETVTQVNHKQD
jgi:HlyD family secretion protein